MGQRGPAPKPVELKALEGNRGHRPLHLDQVFRPEVGAPDAPKWLTPEARKAWRRLSAELLRYNLLSKVDREAFAMLCQTIGRLEIIERSLSARQAMLLAKEQDPADAFVQETPNGMRVQSVIYQLLNREQAKLHKMLESFGLRPDARAQVTTAIRAQISLFDVNRPPASVEPAAEPRGFAEFD